MANICEFKMQLKGRRTGIDKFVDALTWKGRVYIGNGASNVNAVKIIMQNNFFRKFIHHDVCHDAC